MSVMEEEYNNKRYTVRKGITDGLRAKAKRKARDVVTKPIRNLKYKAKQEVKRTIKNARSKVEEKVKQARDSKNTSERTRENSANEAEKTYSRDTSVSSDGIKQIPEEEVQPNRGVERYSGGETAAPEGGTAVGGTSGGAAAGTEGATAASSGGAVGGAAAEGATAGGAAAGGAAAGGAAAGGAAAEGAAASAVAANPYVLAGIAIAIAVIIFIAIVSFVVMKKQNETSVNAKQSMMRIGGGLFEVDKTWSEYKYKFKDITDDQKKVIDNLLHNRGMDLGDLKDEDGKEWKFTDQEKAILYILLYGAAEDPLDINQSSLDIRQFTEEQLHCLPLFFKAELVTMFPYLGRKNYE